MKDISFSHIPFNRPSSIALFFTIILLIGWIFVSFSLAAQAAPAPTQTPVLTQTATQSQQALGSAASTPTPQPAEEDIVRLAWFYKPPENGQLPVPWIKSLLKELSAIPTCQRTCQPMAA